jgi:hypothetical protein
MKKFNVLFVLFFFNLSLFSQSDLYLTFEFMRVDNTQEEAYWETENFWEKIHQKRVESGEIIGWDLWKLLPGGEDQGYQYLVVTVFDDPVKMLEGDGFMESAMAAYPDMKKEDFYKKFDETAMSRDLAARVYLHEVVSTKDQFKMKQGTYANFNLMKAAGMFSDDYVNAEEKVFLPLHQSNVDKGTLGSWSLLEYMMPQGSDVYASHITIDMFDSPEQLFSHELFTEKPSDKQIEAVEAGIGTRDLKMSYLGILVKKVRK